ncbi:MAG: outer membrane beta-barrel protein [candidate division Zixibacteria bacterium]|nr:outer membrane beta-barrel protein [candidate division Zixibacteria bacterium]
MRGIVIGIAALLAFGILFAPSSMAFEKGTFGIQVGGGINIPLLDFGDPYALAATVGFGFKGGVTYQLSNKWALVGYYNYRNFDTHFVEPPTGYKGGYGEYRVNTIEICPRLYFNDEMPSAFIEFGAGAYVPYFYIPGDNSEIDLVPDDFQLGFNAGLGLHTKLVDVALKYNLFKGDATDVRPETWFHFITMDAMINLLPE